METKSITVLSGHDSPETAYVVEDYPYGFRLRCKMRYWLEFKAKRGFRLMSQTTNPKVQGREIWNKPKGSIYSEASVMYLDRQGHVQHISPSVYDLAGLEEFATQFAAGLQDAAHLNALRYLRFIQRERVRRALLQYAYGVHLVADGSRVQAADAG